MPFGTALGLFTKHQLLPLLILLAAISLAQSIFLGTHITYNKSLSSSSTPGHTSFPPPWISNILLGNPSSVYVLIAPFVLFSLVAAVMLEYAVMHICVAGAAAIFRLVQTRGPASMRSALPSVSVTYQPLARLQIADITPSC